MGIKKNYKSFKMFFTPFGGAFLIVSLVMLIRSLLSRNYYEILLSSAALLLLLALGITGLWKSNKLKIMEYGWKIPYPMTACLAGETTIVSGMETSIPLFFRLHFQVRGRFFPGGCSGGKFHDKGCPVLAETSVSRGESSAWINLNFPMSGIFNGSGFCQLCDIFGFYSFACGVSQQRNVKVRSSPGYWDNFYVNAQSGAEDRRNRYSTDEERYYMREYTPGDRFRDINWKSSEKIDTLITRISPDNQEKVSQIEIYFRNFGPTNKPSLEALWLLDRAKARLSYFLRSLMEENSSFVFNVHTAQNNWEIGNSEELDEFLERLAGETFSPSQNEGTISDGMKDVFIFSTACDTGLIGFINACNPRNVNLFIVQPDKIHDKNEKTEIFYKRDFYRYGIIPYPHFLTYKKIFPLGAYTNRIEIVYAETKL